MRGHVKAVHGTRLWLPALGGVFCVNPCLDRRSARRRRFGPQASAVGDVQLQFDEVQTCGGLGDGMFDLQAGVHFEEEEPALLVGHEFDRARTGVSDGLGRQPRGVEQLGAHALIPFDQR